MLDSDGKTPLYLEIVIIKSHEYLSLFICKIKNQKKKETALQTEAVHELNHKRNSGRVLSLRKAKPNQTHQAKSTR